MRKQLLSTILLLMSSLSVVAQGIKMSINPVHPYVDDLIEVSYTLDGNTDDDFKLNGSFGKLRVVAGLSKGSSHRVEIVNGHISESNELIYTYRVMANSAGNYTIPGATCGKHSCASRTIHISEDDGSSQVDPSSPWAMMQQMQRQMQQHMDAIDRAAGVQPQSQAPTSSSSSNVHVPEGQRTFLDVQANKTTAYEQEAIVITYKLYSIDQPANLLKQLNPKFDNFQYKDVPVDGGRTLHRERVKGKDYFTSTMYKYVLFPQKSGRLVIPRVHIELETLSNFDGHRVKAFADSIAFNIKPLPQRPNGFCGAVGHDFKVASKIDANEVAANDAFSYRLIVSGVGNLNLMTTPQIDFPKNIENYEPKKHDETEITSGGYKGDVTYEYAVVPHKEGSYTIPELPFIYFDTSTGKYVTLYAQSHNLRVTRGISGGVSDREDESDICGIHKGAPRLLHTNDSLWGSLLYFMSYVFFLLAALIAFVVTWRLTNASVDLTTLMARRAAKAATKRLRKADRLRRERKNDEFYDEVMRALLGYVSDKLNIQNIELNKDNVMDTLISRGVDKAIIDRFLSVLGECEFARFAPGDPDLTIRKLYDDAFNSIIELDSQLSL